MELEPIIGLEVHAQLNTASKIFCGCSTQFGAGPNENTCPVCLGLPGALPVLNERVVELAVRTALAVHCVIPPFSIFARKNYFYPDLPKGYQISQFDHPLAVDGYVTIQRSDAAKDIRIKRIHMEEDAGKLVHEGSGSKGDASYVDFNRSGVPLIEIVSEPDLHSPEEAYQYLRELKMVLQYTESSEANMEEGNLRCDANVSVRPRGTNELGTRVEIKNLNSFRNVQRALQHEIERQTKLLASGGRVVQETRLFDVNRGVTETMRSKEESHDYRYFPEPDLLPVTLLPEFLNQIKNTLPELPAQRRRRFQIAYELKSAEAEILIEEKALADFFEETAKISNEPQQAAIWIVQSLLEKLKEHHTTTQHSPIHPWHLAELIGAVKSGAINTTQAKELFQEMWDSGSPAQQIIQRRGMAQISDEPAVRAYIEKAMQQNPDVVTRYKAGETKLLGVLVGEVMKTSGGKTNPQLVNRLLREILNS